MDNRIVIVLLAAEATCWELIDFSSLGADCQLGFILSEMMMWSLENHCSGHFLSLAPFSASALQISPCQALWFLAVSHLFADFLSSFFRSFPSSSQSLPILGSMQSAYLRVFSQLFGGEEKSAKGLGAYGATLFNHFFPVLLQDIFKSRGPCFMSVTKPGETLSVALLLQSALLLNLRSRDLQRSFMESHHVNIKVEA